MADLIDLRGWPAVCKGVDDIMRDLGPKDSTAGNSLRRAVAEYVDAVPASSKPANRRPAAMYDRWLAAMSTAITGHSSKATIHRKRLNANIATIREQLDPDSSDREAVDEFIVRGFKAFASHGDPIYGKPAWPIFMAKWPKYVTCTSPIQRHCRDQPDSPSW